MTVIEACAACKVLSLKYTRWFFKPQHLLVDSVFDTMWLSSVEFCSSLKSQQTCKLQLFKRYLLYALHVINVIDYIFLIVFVDLEVCWHFPTPPHFVHVITHSLP